MSKPAHCILNAAIEANLSVLVHGLERAAVLGSMAHNAIRADERNLAIGTILPLEQELPMLMGLLTAILALHRIAGQGGDP